MPENTDDLKEKNTESSAGEIEEEKTTPSSSNNQGEKRKKTTPSKQVESKKLAADEVLEDNGDEDSGDDNGGTFSSPPDDPEEKLKELEAEIKTKEGVLKEKSEELRLNKSDYVDLKKLYEEILSILVGYENGLDQLIDRRGEFLTYSAQRTGAIEEVIGEQNQFKIIEIINEIDTAISDQKKEIEKQIGIVATKESAYDQAKNKFDKRIKDINDSKLKHKNIGLTLNQLGELTKSIEEEEDTKHSYKYELMYVDVLKFNSKLFGSESPPEPFEILSKEELEDELNDAWLYLFNAMDGLRNTKIAWDQEVIKLKDLENNLVKMEKSHDEDIKNEVKKLR